MVKDAPQTWKKCDAMLYCCTTITFPGIFDNFPLQTCTSLQFWRKKTSEDHFIKGFSLICNDLVSRQVHLKGKHDQEHGGDVNVGADGGEDV